MPEDRAYLGTQTARCDISSTAAYCCPSEMKNRVDLGHSSKPGKAKPWSAARLEEPSCIVGSDGADVVKVNGKTPHFVTLGDGDDEVVYLHACELQEGAMVSGGKGYDRLVLPVSAAEAQRLGLQFDGFEQLVEDATRASLFADCEQ
jgi:hypothetical protein